MRWAAAMVFVGWTSASTGEACSAFSGRLGNDVIVGKNFDWSDGRGYLVFNQRGRIRQSLAGQVVSWTARHASLSFTVVGPGLPVSGMNEKGLVFEALVDEQASMAPKSTKALASLEWGQYVLDRFATAEEVADSLKTQDVGQLALPLHFLVCDRAGQCLVVESGAKGTRVTEGSRLKARVLANEPWSVDAPRAAAHLDKNPVSRWFAGTQKSFVRFATLLGASRDKPFEDLAEVWAILEKARIRNVNRWQLVWNQSKLQVSIRMRGGDGEPSAPQAPAWDPGAQRCTDDVKVRDLRPEGMAETRSYGPDDTGRVATRMAQILRDRFPGLARRIADHTLTSRCEKSR